MSKGSESVVLETAAKSPSFASLKSRKQRIATAVLLALSAVYIFTQYDWEWSWRPTTLDKAYDCVQAHALTPQKNGRVWVDFGDALATEEYKTQARDWLSGAVKCPTESYDNMDAPDVDQHWNQSKSQFKGFHDYLWHEFPLVHAKLNLSKINTYGLHYEWTGSDTSLKPLLLVAHQDVVPVDPTTVDKWTYPPYGGHFDGERIWGRGSSDDKSGLIAILATIERLLKIGFEPTRSVVLAFGFDEESSGYHGARHLATHLELVYGTDGFAMLVDEGGGYMKTFGSVYAFPGVTEKGYIDVKVEVSSPGGHSSMPPAHTSIGILSALLVEYELNPREVKITREETFYKSLQCVAQLGKDVPSDLRKIIQSSTNSQEALDKLSSLLASDSQYRVFLQTTQAIDVTDGGVKFNALPEQARAIVNHRIAVTSSVAETKMHDTALLKPLAQKFNLTYSAFGKKVSCEDEGAPSKGTLNLTDAQAAEGFDPAPITPTEGTDAAPYHLLAGTIKATYNARDLRDKEQEEDIIVAPALMTGNTDTRYYWNLTRHIFRYQHLDDELRLTSGVHTVNEWIDFRGLLELIRFYATLILNADESTTL